MSAREHVFAKSEMVFFFLCLFFVPIFANQMTERVVCLVLWVSDESVQAFWCAPTWQHEAWTFLQWTGSCSTILPTIVPNTFIAWAEPPELEVPKQNLVVSVFVCLMLSWRRLCFSDLSTFEKGTGKALLFLLETELGFLK